MALGAGLAAETPASAPIAHHGMIHRDTSARQIRTPITSHQGCLLGASSRDRYWPQWGQRTASSYTGSATMRAGDRLVVLIVIGLVGVLALVEIGVILVAVRHPSSQALGGE